MFCGIVGSLYRTREKYIKIYVKRKNRARVPMLYEFGKIVYENTKKILENGNKMTIL